VIQVRSKSVVLIATAKDITAGLFLFRYCGFKDQQPRTLV
jgi:hypothetical protein